MKALLKPGYMLIVAGLLLELAHSRVKSGAAAADTSLSSIEGQLANIDELTGANLRVGMLLVAIGAFLLYK